MVSCPISVFYASERGSVLAPFRVTRGSELVVLHSLLLIGVNQYRTSGKLAGSHRTCGTRLLAVGPSKEMLIAFFASKWAHENCRQKDRFKDSLCFRPVNQRASAIWTC